MCSFFFLSIKILRKFGLVTAISNAQYSENYISCLEILLLYCWPKISFESISGFSFEWRLPNAFVYTHLLHQSMNKLWKGISISQFEFKLTEQHEYTSEL